MSSIPEEVWTRLNAFISGLRKQAPAANMIGKFAVKQASAEAERRLSSLTKPVQPKNAGSEE